ncbi:MAG: cation:proton antiporter subunit C [Alphaproteobacteria bacterium]
MISDLLSNLNWGHYNYWIIIVLMMVGLYAVIARGNLIKKIVGLNIFQTSVFMLYISLGKVDGGTAPILEEGLTRPFSNPLPHVLILTAIVVGIATTALALALVLRIKAAYGTIEEDELEEADNKTEAEEAQLAADILGADDNRGGAH